jgi:hypothetical protein
MSSYNLNTPLSSKLIYINTLQLPSSSFLNQAKTQLRIVLEQPIQTYHSNQRILISLYSASIPISWYNIDPTQNKFILQEEMSPDVDIIIPPGNYNSRNLCSIIQSLLNSNSPNSFNYSVTYSAIYNKITIICDEVSANITLNFNVDDSIYKAMGFAKANYGFTGNITSPFISQLYDEYSLYLHCDLCNENSLNPMGRISDILENIPISSSNSIVFYQASINQQKQLIGGTRIDSFSLSLTDASGIPIELNGADYELCLKIDFVSDLIHSSKPELTIQDIYKSIEVALEQPEDQNNI